MPNYFDAVRVALERHGYLIEAEIGRGAFATVHRAHDVRHDRTVAVKVLRADCCGPNGVARFSREIRIAARLVHPHILPVHDSGDVAGTFFYVMPYLGDTLRHVLTREGRLDVADAVRIGSQLADALDYAHAKGVLHRDIKPENILIDGSNVALADFGVARALKDDRWQSLTTTGGIVGTPGYMSPEQFAADDVDARTDIYSLGCVLYEMLSGVPYFVGPDGRVDFLRRFVDTPMDLRARNPQVPEALERVIAQAVACSRHDRFASAHVLACALLHPALAPVSTHAPAVPAASDVIIGRETEMAEVGRMLETSRLVTILGAGGVGKTHLALSLARRRNTATPGSTVVVQLAGADERSLASTIAVSLGFEFAGGRDPAEQLIDHLRDKRLLLILDNFEHLTSAAPFIGSLIAHTEAVQCLVTSRERLGLRDETLFELDGLRVTVDDTGTSAAARLFLHAAGRARGRFKPTPADLTNIHRICGMLDGMPLGIEMAAALLRVLESDGIIRELERSFDSLEAGVRDVPERHRTLRAVFDYSWNLLGDAEREGLCRLALFRGSFDHDAAHEVGVSLRVLGTLTDASMIRRTGGGTFVIHPVFRQYAEARLLERSETASLATEQYVQMFARRMRNRGQELRSPSHARALSALTDEIADFRAAWSMAIASADGTALRDLVDGLFHVYDLRGWYREGQLIIDDAIARSPLSAFMLGKLLTYRSRFCYHLSQLGEAIELAKQGRDHFQSVGAEREAANALLHEARALYRCGRFIDAEQVARESLEICARHNVDHGRAMALNDLGYVLAAQGRARESADALRESLALFEQTGDPVGQAKALTNLGGVLDGPDTHAESMDLFERGLRIHQQIGDRRGVGISLHNVARCTFLLGNLERARSFAEASLEIARDLGAALDVSAFLGTLGEIEGHAGCYDRALRSYQEALAIANAAGAPSLAVQHVVDIGRLFLRMGDPAAAVEPLTLAASHPAIQQPYGELAREQLADALRQLPEVPNGAHDVPCDLTSFASKFVRLSLPARNVISMITPESEATPPAPTRASATSPESRL